MSELVEWLTKVLDTLEAGIREALKTEDYGVSESDLDDIAAKRAIVKKYERTFESARAHPDDLATAGALLALLGVIKLLAAPYADWPGYDESWLP